MKKSNISIWKELFRLTLNQVVSLYNISDSEFALETNCSASTLRRWKSGSRLPNDENFNRFTVFLKRTRKKSIVDMNYFYATIRDSFSSYGYKNEYENILFKKDRDLEKIIQILRLCIDGDKGRRIVFSDYEYEKEKEPMKYPSQKKTRAIVFDFDGTLTKSEDPIVKTTWENIWTSLGYDVRECQELHKRFDRKEIDHPEWCRLTEAKFKERRLKKEALFSIAEKIKLIDGIEETFKELRNRDVKIYISSGSIKLIIQTVLGSLNTYVDEIKANIFDFDTEDYLDRIVGTKYDFEGKAAYIRMIADDLHISTEDILFVGNSRNDQFAHLSGAKTLCINPRLTDMTNTVIWNDSIETCKNLTEIIKYIM